ncbi:MAG: MFS transporter [Anaerolineaceae bacterium]|nr:MFS transporter [Anaerolineaceae bacterium]
MMPILERLRKAPRELILFSAISLIYGIGTSMSDSVFNNFIDSRFDLSGFQRSFLEFPRELPGVLVVFAAALLSFLCSRRLSVISMLLGAVGACLIGFASANYTLMVAWLFIYSLGQHLFMPLASTIGMELAREGQTGKRLGQFNAIRNLATILGSFIILLGFHYLGFTFQHAYILIVLAFLVSAVAMLSMKPDTDKTPRTFLKLKKEYSLYYALVIISGARKQIFITFAPWVLVKVFAQPTQTMATLFTIGGVIGILFQPLLGKAIDRFGERTILAGEAVILVFVCFGYGFAEILLPGGNAAFLLVCICFLVDQMLFSVSMARNTYIKKIALKPADIQTTLTAGVSIDHVFSISAALLGGLIWSEFGYQYVFLMGAVIAVINFFTALKIRMPKTT